MSFKLFELFLLIIAVGMLQSRKGGINKGNFYQLFLVFLPNLLHPVKLWHNIIHPIREWIHTRHNQYPMGDEGVYVVEHWFFNTLEIVDVIVEDRWSEGLFAKAKQLFRYDFYYGHAQYFPAVYRLLDRSYVPAVGLNIERHVAQVLSRPVDNEKKVSDNDRKWSRQLFPQFA